MSLGFKFKIYLPSIDEYHYFSQMTNDMFTDIVKIIANGDDELLDTAFSNMVVLLSEGKVTPGEITRIDMFCILLNIYIVCVKNNVELTVPTKEEDASKQKLKLDLYDILDKITNFDFEYTRAVDVNEDMSVHLKPPSMLISPETDEIAIDCIESLTIFSETHKMSTLTSKQRTKIFDNIPSDMINKMIEVMKEIDAEYKLDIIKYGRDDEDKITISLYNNSMFEIIKLIYNQNLQAQYFYTYFLSKHMHIPGIDQYTPAEIQIFMTLFKQEQEEQEKQRKLQEKKSKAGTHLGGELPSGGI